MRRRRSFASESEGAWEIWPAFTDVMSTMALILFVLVLLAYVRNLIASKALDALQNRIHASETRLASMNDELQRASAEVQASQARLRAQENVIAASSHELDALRSQLQSVAVLRVNVLNKLKQAIESELGPSDEAGGALVTIGDNGNVVINESLVFESNSFAIKNEAKPLLNGLARALGNLLGDSAVRENIDTILIQGHTDERGSASFNWDLSAKRATAVLDYLFQTNQMLADEYGKYFAASAYSKFRPLDVEKTSTAYQRNRRIEIAVIPKDANVRKVIDEYMATVPAPATPAPP
jgi:chemotaxis protein MotB